MIEELAFPPWPQFADDDIEAARAVLASGRVNYWTGSRGREFESRFARYVGTHHAIALSNGSVAIGAILQALRTGPGDEVVVTPRSFIASASEIELTGARAVFADVDRDSQNITPQTVAPVLTQKTRGIVAVHLAGWPCDMPGLLDLAKANGLWVVEDCAQSHGAAIEGRPTGSFGRAAAFSFCQDKIMSTGGEGGMVVTDDEEVWSRVWSLKDHGKDLSRINAPPQGPGFRWVHARLGTNYRMTEPQAAIGLCQLEKLDRWVALRQRNAATLGSILSGLPGVRVPKPPESVRHAFYKFHAFLEPDALASGWSRDRVLQELADRGIPCGTGVCPELYLEEAFTSRHGRPQARLPVARELGESSLMFPVHPTLTDEHMERIGRAISATVQRAIR